MAVLRYGIESTISLELANGVPPDQCGTPQGTPLGDLHAAVAHALVDPLDYPPLARSTTPGDRVVLALGHGIPQTAQITATVIQSLLDAGVAADGITVLRTQADVDVGAEDPCCHLSESLRSRITLLAHDPSDRNALAYLAADSAGESILVNRAIHDADLVLPIGCLQPEAAAGYFGIHSAIYPAFSDERTLARFRGLGTLEDRGAQRRQLAHRADHVAWLLGINFTIQLVPAAGDQFLHVLAGESQAVGRRAHELYRAAWSTAVPRQSSLVVAAIEGGASQQTWESVGQAVAAASVLVEAGGDIAVCCDLAAGLGPALQQMAGARSHELALRRIGKDRPPDALPAAQLIHALEQGRVYLLSRLDPAVVEALDVVPIARGEELARLTSRHKSGILLSNAPRAIVTVAPEG